MLQLSSSFLSFPDLLDGPHENVLTVQNRSVAPISMDISTTGVDGVTVKPRGEQAFPVELPAGEVVELVVVFHPGPDRTFCAAPGQGCQFGQLTITPNGEDSHTVAVTLQARTDNLCRHFAEFS